jgi:Tat protein translocase TatB subunit
MFGTLGGPELFLIFVVALIVFGPRKLPEIGKSLGKMMAEFRRASNDFRSTIESEVESEKIRESMRIEPPKTTSPSPATPADTGSAQPRDEKAGSSSAEAAPASPGGTGEPPGPLPAASGEGPTATSPDAGGDERAGGTGVAETVSRQPAAPSTERT